MKRRSFLTWSAGAIVFIGLTMANPATATAQQRKVRVVVWDEQQPAQKTSYSNFLGNEIAVHLRKSGAFDVKSVRLDDPDQGLSRETLDNCDVLLWWGHVRHGDVKDDLAKDISRRVKDGKLAFLPIHSAHWSKPFIELMNERSIMDALSTLPRSERGKAKVVTLPGDRRLMDPKERMTPYHTRKVEADGSIILEVKLPSCAFPYVEAHGKPSRLTTLLPKHPIAKGLPATFEIPQTELYGGPFHAPKPDAQIFDEKWESGHTFPAGCAWQIGKGRVFYFRPGHETFPVFKQPETLKVIENAVAWLAKR